MVVDCVLTPLLYHRFELFAIQLPVHLAESKVLMRIALIADIHGNFVSFNEVIKDIKERSVDQIVFLGDAVTLGPQPREVIAQLKNLKCSCVMGNHENYLFDPAACRKYENTINAKNSWLTKTIEWCIEQLSKDDLDYLGSFQPLIKISLGKSGNLICFHGTPKSTEKKILSTTPIDSLDEMLKGYKATIMAGAHTHTQMLRQYKGIKVLTVGSVGMPFQQVFSGGTMRYIYHPWAEYTIIDSQKSNLNLEFRKIPIDLSAILNASIGKQYAGRDIWVHNWQK